MSQSNDIHSTPQRTKSIASNTMLLFIRMFILTIINLYAVRLILKGLGQEDYGIFTTIAGVVTTASVFSSVLALSIQRFFSYYLGVNEASKLRDIFSCSINIILILSVIILILLETVGLWFVHTQLVIPHERFEAALWIYQFAIAMLICSFLQIPFMSAVFAHEDMGSYTIISTIECLLKLLAAYVIGIVLVDHLKLYTFGLLLTAIIILFCYIITARRYEECHYRKPHDKRLYHELLSFSGWSLFGTVANTGLIQGSTLLLNVFFGPIITAAFGIAMNIYNAFGMLCNSIVLAFRPPMIKAYAEKDNTYLTCLFYASNKFLVYALICIAVPMIALMDTILQLWLGDYTSDTLTFARFTIIHMVVITLHHPITIIIQATGRIRNYHLFVESFTLLSLPITWLLSHTGHTQSSVYIAMIGTCACAHIIRLLILRQEYHAFAIGRYCLSIFIPAIVVCSLSGTTAYLILQHIPTSVLQKTALLFIPPLITILLTYLIGIDKQEKDMIRSLFIQHVGHRFSHS